MALGETNISVTLVKTELTSSVTTVGGLCVEPLVNKWSEKKPVVSVGATDWWKDATGNYSLDIVEQSIGNLDSGSNWTYLKPTGANPTSGWRLGDFRGYNHSATATIRFNPYLTPSDGGSITGRSSVVKFAYNKNGDSDGITLTDLGYGNWYFGIRLSWTESGSPKAYFITSATVISNVTNYEITADLNQAIFDNITTGTTIYWSSYISDTIIGTYSTNTWVTEPALVQVVKLPNIAQKSTTNSNGTFILDIATITCSPTSYELNKDGETKDFTVTTLPTAGTWVVTSVTADSNIQSDDMVANGTFIKAAGNTTLRVTVIANNNPGTAGADILLTHTGDSNVTKTVRVTQPTAF